MHRYCIAFTQRDEGLAEPLLHGKERE